MHSAAEPEPEAGGRLEGGAAYSGLHCWRKVHSSISRKRGAKSESASQIVSMIAYGSSRFCSTYLSKRACGQSSARGVGANGWLSQRDGTGGGRRGVLFVDPAHRPVLVGALAWDLARHQRVRRLPQLGEDAAVARLERTHPLGRRRVLRRTKGEAPHSEDKGAWESAVEGACV